MNDKIVLDLCGGTGAWSRPYWEAGYDVRLITLPDYDVTRWREYPDLVEIVESGRVHGVLAAPPCTMFSFARTTAQIPRDLREGMQTVRACLEVIWQAQFGAYDAGHISTFTFWALENPHGYLRRFLGAPAFDFQPYYFGDRYSKRTLVWGKLAEPKKCPVKLTADERDASRRNLDTKLPSISDFVRRPALRAITPAGFARAFFEANR